MSDENLNINVHHVTRVEGHGNLVVNMKEGSLERAELEIVEAPRFFESMLRGRQWHEAPYITSRICGICSVGHAQASINALEDAFGVTPSEQTVRLRRLLFNAETMQSHWLHVFLLVIPDFFGAGSALEMAQEHPETVRMALRLRKTANDLADLLCGRKVHPVAMKVNGFSSLPTAEQLGNIRERLVEARKDVAEVVRLLGEVDVPDFERETEYVALHLAGEYAWLGGDIRTTDGYEYSIQDYRKLTNETTVPHSTAKHARHARESYMVGALARYKVNHQFLRPGAADVADELGLTPDCVNPYMNNMAQIVESVHCLEDSIELIDRFLAEGLNREPREVEVRAGTGVGAAEVPRGVLFHEYEIDDAGHIVRANCVIPTGQNLANIEADMRALVPRLVDRPREEITLRLEMLVRAYDPCISCSTHFLDVSFID